MVESSKIFWCECGDLSHHAVKSKVILDDDGSAGEFLVISRDYYPMSFNKIRGVLNYLFYSDNSKIFSYFLLIKEQSELYNTFVKSDTYEACTIIDDEGDIHFNVFPRKDLNIFKRIFFCYDYLTGGLPFSLVLEVDSNASTESKTVKLTSF